MSKTTRGTTHTSRGKHKLARLLHVRRRNKKKKTLLMWHPPITEGGYSGKLTSPTFVLPPRIWPRLATSFCVNPPYSLLPTLYGTTEEARKAHPETQIYEFRIKAHFLPPYIFARKTHISFKATTENRIIRERTQTKRQGENHIETWKNAKKPLSLSPFSFSPKQKKKREITARKKGNPAPARNERKLRHFLFCPPDFCFLSSNWIGKNNKYGKGKSANECYTVV